MLICLPMLMIALNSSDRVIAEPGVDSSDVALHFAAQDSTFEALTHAFRHQTVAAVYFHGRRYEVANPKIEREGFAYRRVTAPEHVAPEAVPNPIPWADVDSLLLRRTQANNLGTAGAITVAFLGGLYGWALGVETDNRGAQIGAIVVGAAAGAAVGYIAGGFVGGWFHRWVQVYPQVTPEPTRGKPIPWRGQK